MGASEADLKKRTLTNLYNARPTWLAHRAFDQTVLDAYGWAHGFSDEEILPRLVAHNLERAARQHRGEHKTASALQMLFPPDTGCYKIGADQEAGRLLLRFAFPARAQARYAEQLAALAGRTGWQVRVHPTEHQGALDAAVRQVLPPEVTLVRTPSFHHERREVVVRYRGPLTPAASAAATTALAELTG